MNRSHAIAKRLAPAPVRRIEGEDDGKLVVNVLFTSPEATAAALESARSLAQDLGAVIRLRAPIVVPWQLPQDRPAVPLRFTENLLRELVSLLDIDAFEPSIHLYLCRDRSEALSEILSPNSLVVMGGRKRWWPNEEKRLAKELSAAGHRVVFADRGKDSPWHWR